MKIEEDKKRELWSRILSSPMFPILLRGTFVTGTGRYSGMPWKTAIPFGFSMGLLDLLWTYLERMSNLYAIKYRNPDIKIPKSVYAI